MQAGRGFLVEGATVTDADDKAEEGGCEHYLMLLVKREGFQPQCCGRWLCPLVSARFLGIARNSHSTREGGVDAGADCGSIPASPTTHPKRFSEVHWTSFLLENQ